MLIASQFIIMLDSGTLRPAVYLNLIETFLLDSYQQHIEQVSFKTIKNRCIVLPTYGNSNWDFR